MKLLMIWCIWYIWSFTIFNIYVVWVIRNSNLQIYNIKKLFRDKRLEVASAFLKDIFCFIVYSVRELYSLERKSTTCWTILNQPKLYSCFRIDLFFYSFTVLNVNKASGLVADKCCNFSLSVAYMNCLIF